MTASGPHRMAAPGKGRAIRKAKFALPLSIALHVVILFGVTRMSWVVPEAATSNLRPTVVWLNDLRSPARNAAVPNLPAVPRANDSQTEATPPAEDAPPRRSPSPPIPQPRTAISDVAPPAVAELPTRAAEPATEVEPRPVEPTPAAAGPVAPLTAPITTQPRRAYFAPGVDWQKEREQAAARVIEQQAREGAYPTFSLDDIIEPRVAPTPPTAIAEAVADPCKVASNKWEKFALQMIGRCVRAARGDLFADIKPGYLRNRPVCEETRPGQAPVLDARGNEISTVKCRLADEDELADVSVGEPRP